MNPKITIAIPAYNNANVISETIESALAQEYPNKEVLVVDDCSTDDTVKVAQRYPVSLFINSRNLGIGKNLVRAMDEAKGKYIVYLCADDVFTNTKILGDIVRIFDSKSDIGVIGRYFYFFMHGQPGAIGVCRDKNILTQSCCPSGMAFRRMDVEGTNNIFIEMPYIVAQYLKKWKWTMFEYDTVAARFHPGGNTGTKKSYYKESPLQNWIYLLGDPIRFNQGFIQLKNRAPKMLWPEIMVTVKMDKGILRDPSFWFYAFIALIFPGWILRPLTNFYRHRIARRFAKIINRPEGEECLSVS